MYICLKRRTIASSSSTPPLPPPNPLEGELIAVRWNCQSVTNNDQASVCSLFKLTVLCYQGGNRHRWRKFHRGGALHRCNGVANWAKKHSVYFCRGEYYSPVETMNILFLIPHHPLRFVIHQTAGASPCPTVQRGMFN